MQATVLQSEVTEDTEETKPTKMTEVLKNKKNSEIINLKLIHLPFQQKY